MTKKEKEQIEDIERLLLAAEESIEGLKAWVWTITVTASLAAVMFVIISAAHCH